MVPLYCENQNMKRDKLHAFRIPETVPKGAMLLFQKDHEGSFFQISSKADGLCLRWHKSPQQLKTTTYAPPGHRINLYKKEKLLDFKEDWSKIIHLE